MKQEGRPQREPAYYRGLVPRRFISLVKQPDRSSKQERTDQADGTTEDGPLAKYTRHLRTATVWIAIAGGVALITATLQWCALHQTDETVRRALIEVQRAFVFVSIILHEPESVGKKAGITLFPVWENAGTTPTKNLLIKGYCLPSEIAVADTFVDPRSIEGGPTPNVTLGPGLTINGPRCWVNPDFLDLIQKGKAHYYVWGYATYDDVFDRSHRTEFCNEVVNPRLSSVGLIAVLQLCPKHNCADDECDPDPPHPPATFEPALSEAGQ